MPDSFEQHIRAALRHMDDAAQRARALALPDAQLVQALSKLRAALDGLQEYGPGVNTKQLLGQQYRALFLHAADSLVVTDPAGTICEANHAAVRLFGMAEEALVGCTMSQLVAPSDQRQLVELLAEGLQAAVSPEAELQVRRADETLRRMAARAVVLQRADRTPEWVCWRLRPCVADPQEAQPDSAAPQDAGPRREQQAQALAETAQQRLALLAEASRRLATTLDDLDVLNQVARLATGSLADWCVIDLLDESGAIRPVALAHRDPEKEALLRNLPQVSRLELGMHHPVVTVIQTGQLQFIPDQVQVLLEAGAVDAEHLQLLRSLGAHAAMVLPLRARGRVIGALSLLSTQPGRYDRNDLTLGEDLAQRIATAVENVQLYREARAALAARDQFLSIASHDLKSPLTAVRGYAQLLRQRVTLGSPLSERDLRGLQLIDEQAQRCVVLLDELLHISSLQRGQVSLQRCRVDLVALVGALVEQLQPTLEQRRVLLDTPAAGLVVEGDVMRLEQVVQNLLDNALKYSPAEREVRISLSKSDGDALVSITDQGIGIPPEALPHLFESFYRANNARERAIQGTGLGLYIVKQIISLHGGSVEVSSVINQGSAFTIRLPLAA